MPATYAANRARMQRLAFYSRTRLNEITEHHQFEYDRSRGYMVMLRGEKDRKLVQPGLQVLRDAGVAFKEIDAEEARRVEPAINPDISFVGAVHLPADEVGNCRQFALLLKNQAQSRGVVFEFNQAVDPLDAADPASLTVWTLGEARSGAAALRCRDRVRRGRIGAAAGAAGPEDSPDPGLRLLDQRAAARAAQCAAQRA